MSEEREPNSPSVTPTKKSPLTQIDEALREIIREELGRTPTSTPEKRPHLGDAAWLVVIVTNLALLLALIPDSVLQSTKLGLIIKVIPWLGSYLFVLGYAWFSDQIIRFTRQPAFKVTQIVMLVVLAGVSFSRLQVFDIHPLIEPQGAEVMVDGGLVTVDKDGSIAVSLKSHDITITDKSDKNQRGEPNEREFQLSFRDAFHAWRDSNYKPHWPLTYEIWFTAEKPISELEIRKIDGNFDADFWAKPSSTASKRPLTRGRDVNVLLFAWEQNTRTVAFDLPFGTYKVLAKKFDCQGIEEHEFTARSDAENIRFQKDLCLGN